jgi:hypothetical protein
MIRAAFFLAAGGAGEEQWAIALRHARKLSNDTLLILPVLVTCCP